MQDFRRTRKMRVKNPENYDVSFPFCSQPKEIGFFSRDFNGDYCDDDHQMKYLYMPRRSRNLNTDLKEGFDEFIDAEESRDLGYNMILEWILSHQDQVRRHFGNDRSSGRKLNFVCRRGLLAAVSSSIYERNEDWEIYATKFRSAIYLSQRKTDRKMERAANASDRDNLMSYWGVKFEQCMTSDAPHSAPDTSVPVNANGQYFTVITSQLQNNNLLFFSEIDAIDPRHIRGAQHDSTLRYTELKTSRIMTEERHKRNFLRFKLMKWYLQSFFSATPKIICGFRDDDGMLLKLKVYDTRELPTLAGGLWSHSACLNFCTRFLDFVKQCVVKDDPEVVYRFYWEPGSDVICEELGSEYRFLPDWYTNEVTAI